MHMHSEVGVIQKILTSGWYVARHIVQERKNKETATERDEEAAGADNVQAGVFQ